VNRWRWLIVGVVVAVIVAIPAALAFRQATRHVTTGERIPGLKTPEKLILYSIDGTEDFEANRDARLATAEELFRGYPVLGKTEVTSENDRNELIAVLQDGIVHHDGIAAKCFWPRHAILASEGGKTFEIVICFQCQQYTLDGRHFPLISKRAEQKFNDYLRQHHVEIAP